MLCQTMREKSTTLSQDTKSRNTNNSVPHKRNPTRVKPDVSTAPLEKRMLSSSCPLHISSFKPRIDSQPFAQWYTDIFFKSRIHILNIIWTLPWIRKIQLEMENAYSSHTKPPQNKKTTKRKW